MLALLTDAHISPRVAEQVKAKQPEIVMHSLQHGRAGTLLRAADDVILAAAHEEGVTFVTYDQRTVVPLATQWAMSGQDHAGIVLIDEKSIAQEDIGGKVRALLALWKRANHLDWTNAVAYLSPDG